MENAVGIFAIGGQAYEAVQDLQTIGITSDQINILLPGAVPLGAAPAVSEAEQPGVGSAIGAVVGGATGAFAGASIVALTLPAIGVVTAIGVAATTIAGLIGGAVAGHALERLDNGLPIDEIYVYEDALRHGRVVVVVQTSNAGEASRVRELFALKGAESVDAARDQWWTGLRSAPEAHYQPNGANFDRKEELEYRRGFEIAQSPATRGKSYTDAAPYLKSVHPNEFDREAFRRGYERGRQHRQHLSAGTE